MQTLNFSEPSVSVPTRIGDKENPVYADIRVTEICAQTLLYDRRITLEEERVKRLRKYSLVFGIASLICLCMLVTCLALRVQYEPAAAMMSCCVGIFAVFLMKVKDAKR
jgi:hypothetical protein